MTLSQELELLVDNTVLEIGVPSTSDVGKAIGGLPSVPPPSLPRDKGLRRVPVELVITGIEALPIPVDNCCATVHEEDDDEDDDD